MLIIRFRIILIAKGSCISTVFLRKQWILRKHKEKGRLGTNLLDHDMEVKELEL